MKIKSGTIARTIALALALINQLLMAFDYNVINISEDTINTLVGTVFTVVTALVAFWKNNSFTPEALKADEVLKELKSAKKE